MPLDRTNKKPMQLIGRLAALAETAENRLPLSLVDLALVFPIRALPNLKRRIRKAGNTEIAGEVFDQIDLATIPGGPVPIDKQSDYWIGYYHQCGYPRHVAASRNDLEEAGLALFGSCWQTDMAQLLRYSDAAHLRAVLRYDRPIAGGALADLVAELRQRSVVTAKVAERLEKLLAIRRTT